jgi:hypothetical protein
VLCADLGIRPALIRFDTVTNAAQSIFRQCDIEGRLSELMEWCKNERPRIVWPALESNSNAKADIADLETRRYLAELRSYLVVRFNKSELRNLAFAAGADVAGLDWSRGLQIITLGVIQHLHELGKTGSLVYQANQERASVPPPDLPPSIQPASAEDIARIDRRQRMLYGPIQLFFPNQLREICQSVGCDSSDIELTGYEGDDVNLLAERLIFWSESPENWAKLKEVLSSRMPDADLDQFDLPVAQNYSLDSLKLSKQLLEALSRIGIHTRTDLLDLVESQQNRPPLSSLLDKKLEKELLDALRTNGWIETPTKRLSNSAKSKIRAAARKK